MAERLALLDVSALVIAHHHDMAKGVLLGLVERGLRWPTDLSIVLIGTPEWRDLIQPSLACVERPEQQMGHEAALQLLRKIEHPDHNSPMTVLATRFLDGGSVGPPPERKVSE